MSLDQIKAAIPHREPFLLLDEIVERDENRIVCRKMFHGDEFWFAGHYPEDPLVPGVLLCEAGMQAGAVLLAGEFAESDGVPVATRLFDVKFKRIVRPGDTITMEVTLDDRVSNAFYLSGKVTVEGQTAARFGFACTMTTANN